MNLDLFTVVLSATISLVVAFFGLVFSHLKHKREIKTALNKIHEEISLELIKERIIPYCEFMSVLKKISSYKTANNISIFDKNLLEVKKYIHEGLYSRVGVLASHDTRQFMRLVRLGIDEYQQGIIGFNDLKNTIWALHFSLRGDLGIKQPHWDSEIEVFRKQSVSQQQLGLDQLLRSDYWDFIKIDSVFMKDSISDE